MQVIHMLFSGDFDSIFTFFFMQVSIILFWIEFDLIFAFFYMQVIIMCSGLSWTLYLRAGYYHGALDYVGLHLRLHAGYLHGILNYFRKVKVKLQMHASVSEICLGLQLSVKVKGCMLCSRED